MDDFDFDLDFDVDLDLDGLPELEVQDGFDGMDGRFVDSDADMVPDVTEGVDIDRDGVLDAHDSHVDVDQDGLADGPDGPDMDGDGVGDAAEPFADTDGDLVSDHAFTKLIEELNLFDPFAG